LDEDAPGPTTLPRQESGVALSEMARAYGRLAPPQREVLALVVFEGMSYEQVGEVIGVPIGTVRSRLSRARSALREMFPDDRH
jgi:RNA polymerase sigma-70 factor (ECF subfamily)